MAVAGWCAACGQYVYVTENWGCANGHAWDQLSAWYDPDSGQPVTPYWLAPQAPAAPGSAVAPAVAAAVLEASDPEAPALSEPIAPTETTVGSRLELLASVLAALQANHAYDAQYGSDTDIVLSASPLSANWGVGGKRVDYSAIMKAVEDERVLYFWEMLKEQSGGLSFGGFESESYSTVGTRRFGKKSETVVTPDGAVGWSWDYGDTRKLVEAIAAEYGWRVKTVLRKKSAQW